MFFKPHRELPKTGTTRTCVCLTGGDDGTLLAGEGTARSWGFAGALTTGFDDTLACTLPTAFLDAFAADFGGSFAEALTTAALAPAFVAEESFAGALATGFDDTLATGKSDFLAGRAFLAGRGFGALLLLGRGGRFDAASLGGWAFWRDTTFASGLRATTGFGFAPKLALGSNCFCGTVFATGDFETSLAGIFCLEGAPGLETSTRVATGFAATPDGFFATGAAFMPFGTSVLGATLPFSGTLLLLFFTGAETFFAGTGKFFLGEGFVFFELMVIGRCWLYANP
ncbi:MAG: hypothetical protein LBD01_00205 [Puniceicoccales bacterium]|jgi:hypothetical protein|nr:hypothetical protein [Puniceicoccales bacterium]